MCRNLSLHDDNREGYSYRDLAGTYFRGQEDSAVFRRKILMS